HRPGRSPRERARGRAAVPGARGQRALPAARRRPVVRHPGGHRDRQGDVRRLRHPRPARAGEPRDGRPGRRPLRAARVLDDQPGAARRARRDGARRPEPCRLSRRRFPRARVARQRSTAHRPQTAASRGRLSMQPITDRKTRELAGVDAARVPRREPLEAGEPALLRGLVKGWPLVEAGRRSAVEAIDYLLSFFNGRTVGAYFGAPEMQGRWFYDDELRDLNFESRRTPLDEVLEALRRHLDEQQPPAVYVGSTTIDACLPGLRAANDLAFDDPMFERNAPLASIWIGNRSLVSAHFDAPSNMVCCAVGRRRYTLFPPDQIVNLYPGPLDPTPGGQPVSMVNFAAPDFTRHPGFREAIAAAQVADLEPGDALFYPAMWWHQVEAFDAFNVMINYWWSTSPKFMDT